MRASDFWPNAPGTLVDIRPPRRETGLTFLSDELPPEFTIDAEIVRKAGQVGIAPGNVNGLGHQLPNPWMFINPFVRREARASSRIEGTRADSCQVVLFEAEQPSGKEDPDIQEVVSAWSADKEWLVSTSSVWGR